MFTYSIHAAAGAIKGFLASIPVVGWVLMALSAIVGGGVALWGKYTASLREADEAARQSKMEELAKQQENAAKAAMEAVKGESSLTDAIKEAGKAAAKTLLPFDEIHSIQKEMAGLDDIGDMGLPDVDAPGGFGGLDLDWSDVFAGLEDQKPTFKGFWKYIMDEVEIWLRKLLGKYYDAFAEGKLVAALFADLWVWVKKKWEEFKAWARDFWIGVQEKWENFKQWASEKWQAFWNPIRQKWENFKQWAREFWGEVQQKWENFKTWASEKWQAFWSPIQQKWEGFKSWAKNLWGEVQQKWEGFTGWARGVWDRIQTKWDEIKSWSLWGWISTKVNWLKNIFNFSWSLPRIKLPHFTLSWSTSGFWESLGLPGKPNIGVSWYAKGGVFDKPSLIGVGEAGREAVLPLDQNTGWMDDLADKINATGGGEGPLTIQLIVGGEKILEEVIDAAARKNARAGKTVLQMGV
jgi:hypothetical protein